MCVRILVPQHYMNYNLNSRKNALSLIQLNYNSSHMPQFVRCEMVLVLRILFLISLSVFSSRRKLPTMLSLVSLLVNFYMVFAEVVTGVWYICNMSATGRARLSTDTLGPCLVIRHLMYHGARHKVVLRACCEENDVQMSKRRPLRER